MRSIAVILAAAFTVAGVAAILFAGAPPALAKRLHPPGLTELAPTELDRRATDDLRLLRSWEHATRRLLVEIEKTRSTWTALAGRQASAVERERTLALAEQVVEHTLALESLARYHADFWRIDAVRDMRRHARHFELSYAASCLQLRLGVAFVKGTQGIAGLETLLDEGSPQHALAPGAYAKLKWRVLHVEDVARWTAGREYHRFLGIFHKRMLAADRIAGGARAIVDGALPAIEKRFAQPAAVLLTRNGLDILSDATHAAWLPVQTGVADWLGDTRVKRGHDMLVGEAQALVAAGRSRPGDIVLERRNWYLSNVGLPGFWPHAALYLGTPAEAGRFLDADPAVARAYPGGFAAALRERHPQAYARWSAKADGGCPPRLIEAMSEGVVFTCAEYSLSADYAAALRPRLPPLEVARAIDRAFGFAGRPYDFDFDFASDRELVCSELVYKAYEPRPGVTGLRFDLVEVVGRRTLPPNVLVAQFDRELGTPAQQLDFVWFLDGSEREARARWSDERALRASHRRPKWDVAQK